MINLDKLETYFENKFLRFKYLYIVMIFLYFNFFGVNFGINIPLIYLITCTILFILKTRLKKPKLSNIKIFLNLLALFCISLRGIENIIINYIILFYYFVVLIEPFFNNKLYYLRLFLIISFILESSFTKFKNYNLGNIDYKEIVYPDKILPTKEIKNIGYIFKPNSKITVNNITSKKDTVSKINYCSDYKGSRIDCNSKRSLKKKNFVCFLGCSFTFGLGVDFNNTFGNILERKVTNFSTYNFGCFGYGPHQVAIQLKPKNQIITNNSISEESGYFVYTYIDDHLNRVYGGSDYLQYGDKTSDVYIRNNEIYLNKRNTFKMYFCKIIRESNFLKYFDVKLNYPKSNKFYIRFAKIINYCFLRTSKIKNKSKFIVGIYPNHGNDLKWIKFLNKKIKVIIVNKPKDFTEGKYLLKNDCHPNSLLNEFYINKIIKEIK